VKVRGITVLTHKVIVTRRFGAEAWARFYDDVASAHRCFRSFITPDSLIPLSAFLAFHDELIRRFHRDTNAGRFEVGREVCRWALNEGPFRTFKEKPNLADLVASLPKLHRMYFTDTTTRSEAALVGDAVEFKVFDLPKWHPYFEHSIVGYLAEVLEMFCANPIRVARLRGGSARDYAYLLCASRPDPAEEAPLAPAPSRLGPVALSEHRLARREMDVLLLLAHGKTNEEIGAALGISPKTAQHSVARAYRKIGVSGRVGAALWLAERGLVGR
jgi:DNA-binding CsgD family transcriptional regulator